MARINLAKYSFKTYFQRVLIFLDVKYEVSQIFSLFYALDYSRQSLSTVRDLYLF